MKKIYGVIIAILFLICFILYNSKHTIKDEIDSDVFISGHIFKILKSSNHSFGIYFIKVDSSNINKFLIASFENQCPAFQINKDTAEIYSIISIDDSLEDIITINGPANVIEVKNNKKDISQRYIVSVFDGTDRKYIVDNTLFR